MHHFSEKMGSNMSERSDSCSDFNKDFEEIDIDDVTGKKRSIRLSQKEILPMSLGVPGDNFRGDKKKSMRLSRQQIKNMHFGDPDGTERGIYWFSPTSMILSYLVGLAAAIGQHVFYSELVGTYVGTINDQQRVLRYGTTLAFVHQIALVSSVSIAYIQILWRSLRRANLSIRGLDAAFGAHTSLLSFLNWEMIANVKLPSIIALIAWTLPIASLVAPATLSIGLTMRDRSVMTNVFSTNISDVNQAHRYAYAVPSNLSLPDEKTYLRPRTVLTRLVVASSTTATILPITPPFTNATYEVNFYGPVVKCKDASRDVADQIQAATERTRFSADQSLMQIQNSYFSFVPDLSREGLLANNGVVQVANHSDTSGALHGSNELWLGFNRYYDNPDGSFTSQPHKLECQLWNTSYQVDFRFVQGIQSITWKALKPLNLVPYPTGPSRTDQDEMDMAYTSFMWTLSDQLVGSIGFYSNITADPSSGGSNTFSQILTSLQETALLGSSDLQSFFDYNRVLYPSKKGTGTEKVSDQRAADIALARNRTLDVLIEELSANITVSMMSSDLLSPPVLANVTTNDPINVYLYDPKNLFLSYGIALFFALIAIILGALAYISNGVSHDNSFSSIVRATRNPDLLDFDQRRVPGALPLDKNLGQTVLRLRNNGFVIWQDQKH